MTNNHFSEICKLPFFQIEEINFREDDISADMIPVPQKKGRGRPRKYLRLEDVLEWRLQKEKGGSGDPGSNPGIRNLCRIFLLSQLETQK